MSKPAKPRRYTAAEILHAIAREYAKPRAGSAGLCCPDVIRNLTQSGKRPVQIVLPGDVGVRQVGRWIDALDPVGSIILDATFLGTVHVTVHGRIPRGPVIELTAPLYGLVIDEPLADNEKRSITVAEFHALDVKRSGGDR